ncbi:MAG: nucleotidyltransferase domain-containing protein [Patescibacteria group bacterium]
MQHDLQKLAKKYKLDFMVLFGSTSKDTTHAKSDVDIAINTKYKMNLSKELALRSALFKIFKKEIDLVFIKEASPLLLGEIASDGRFLCGNRQKFLNFRVISMMRFIDFGPYFALREKTLRQTISSYAK